MNKVLFIISHFGSDSSNLCKILEKTSKIQWFITNEIYDHPDALLRLTSRQHKIKNSSAIWMEELLDNHRFSHKEIYKFAKFIYFIRDAKPTFYKLAMQESNFEKIINYYTFRLRRIYEMARKSQSNSIFLTWNEAANGSGFEKISSFLDVAKINYDEQLFQVPERKCPIPENLLNLGREYYDKFFYLMSNLKKV